MGKLENNKQQKRTSLLDTAFKLFTTQGVSKTSIAEISQKAGIAKGTFYLYFKDKYDIRNKLVSHEASKLFKNAVSALELHIKEQQINDHSFTITFTEEIIFIADHIINVLNTNQTLLTFISKNLSWGIFKEALTFVKNEKGRPEAQEGSHDDLVMGTAITYYIRDQQKTRVENTQSVVNENVFYSFDNDKKFKEDYGETIEVI